MSQLECPTVSKALTYNATLLERRDLSPSLSIFRLAPEARPADDAPWFEPGQYVSVGLNVDEDGGSSSVQRAYSIASEPEQRRWLELYIRRASPANTAYPLTHRLWQIEPGGRLYVSPKISGHFTLQHTVPLDDPRLRVLVGSGTGVAPFMSMVRSALGRGDRALLGRLVVLHGASHAHELGYHAELEAAVRAGLRAYVATVSRPAENPDWRGAVGRVETHFEGDKLHELERHLGLGEGGLSPRRAVAYVCGFTGTIVGLVSSLLAREFAPAERRVRRQLEIPAEHPPSLFYEQYDPGSILDQGGPELVERLKAVFRRATIRPPAGAQPGSDP